MTGTGPPGGLNRPLLRGVLAFAALVVAVTGFLLFVLAERTADYFAWTIKSPLTAAFMGASYWGTIALEAGAARERLWANARVAVPAIWVFTALTLGITVLHRDRFHFGSGDVVSAGIAWGWLVLYVVVPALLGLAWLRQGLIVGGAHATARLLAALRGVLGVAGAGLLAFGVALLAVPVEAGGLWPWTLTDLTGRAVGAWLVGFGMLAVTAALDGDRRRTRVVFPALVAWPVLQAAAVARYGDEVDWASPSAWVFVLALACFFAMGIAGLRLASRAETGTA